MHYVQCTHCTVYNVPSFSYALDNIGVRTYKSILFRYSAFSFGNVQDFSLNLPSPTQSQLACISIGARSQSAGVSVETRPNNGSIGS